MEKRLNVHPHKPGRAWDQGKRGGESRLVELGAEDDM